MSVQDRYVINENILSNNLENILKESSREMKERKQMILLGIDSHAVVARKEVRLHILQFAQVKSALSSSGIHLNS